MLKSEQIAKYKSLSKNIILTDYLQFIWINKDGRPERDAVPPDRSRKSKISSCERIASRQSASCCKGFSRLRLKASGARSSWHWQLATRSKLLRDYLGEELVRQEREHKEGRLYGLFQIFRDQVFHELTLKEFADAFAQMLAYGLFLARLNSDSKLSRCTMRGNMCRARSG